MFQREVESTLGPDFFSRQRQVNILPYPSLTFISYPLSPSIYLDLSFGEATSFDVYSIVWCSMVWCGMAWYSMVWYVWYGMYGMVWYGIVWYYARLWCAAACFGAMVTSFIQRWMKTRTRLMIPTRSLEMISIDSSYHSDLLVKGAIKMRLRAISAMPATISQLCFAPIHSSEALLLSPLGGAMAMADKPRTWCPATWESWRGSTTWEVNYTSSNALNFISSNLLSLLLLKSVPAMSPSLPVISSALLYFTYFAHSLLPPPQSLCTRRRQTQPLRPRTSIREEQSK